MKLIFGLGLIALVGYWPAAKTPKRVNSLFLQNVEALAGSEHVTNLGCLGDGSVDCPINHIKVEYVVQGFSLGDYINLITLESFIALLTWVRKGVDDLRPGKVLESFTPG